MGPSGVSSGGGCGGGEGVWKIEPLWRHLHPELYAATQCKRRIQGGGTTPCFFRNCIQNPVMAATLGTLAIDLCNKITEQYQQLLSLADDHDTSSVLFNGQQCMVAYNKLLETQGTLELLQRELPPDEETSSPDHAGQATQELVQVLTRAYETFFKDCFCTDWMESALRQHGDVKETVSEILYDLQWCRSVLCSILLKRAGQDSQALMPEDCDGTLSVTDRYALSTAAKKDQENLKAPLRALKVDHTCSGECWNGKQVSVPCLATQLLEKFDFQAQPKAAQEEYYNGLPAHDRKKLSKWPLALLISPQDRSQGPFVASGSFGDVFRTAWRGETYAMKVPKPGCLEIFKQEIAALGGMDHPHIMRLVCCTEGPATRDCSYLMEFMDMTLFGILEEHQILCLLQAVDLMLQVAEGMKYLHNIGLVHRDLKPHNILVKKVQQVSFPHPNDDPSISMLLPLSNPVWIAKISDFGTSKAKNESTAYSHHTINIGSTMYMAPEVYNLDPDDEEPERFHPMKTDVYSFGILCFVIVTGKSSPFEFEELVPTKKFKDNVRQGKRPTLPADCPARLSWLITRCWHGDPLSRPSFHDICRELRYIKGLLLTGICCNLDRLSPGYISHVWIAYVGWV